MNAAAHTILIFSFEPWGEMWYSKHHYAAELAKFHTVYFISPPHRWQLRDLFNSELAMHATPEGVVVVSYRYSLPLRILPGPLQRLLYKRTAKRLAKLLGNGPNLLWYFHPTALVHQYALRSGNTKLIYHVVDPYQQFAWDVPCARVADLVVTINQRFAERYERLNSKVLLVPHGISSVQRDGNGHHPHGTAQRPYLVLAGGFNASVNYDLLTELAMRLPLVELVLAGTLFDVPADVDHRRHVLLQLPNVRYAGTLPPGELATLIRDAVCGLVAYDPDPVRRNGLELTRTPLKAVSYLAQRIPVITTTDLHIPQLVDSWVINARDPGSFVTAVNRFLEAGQPADTAVLDDYMEQHGYDRLIARIFEALYRSCPPEIGNPTKSPKEPEDRP